MNDVKFAGGFLGRSKMGGEFTLKQTEIDAASNTLHLSNTSGMAIHWEATDGAVFTVWRCRQLNIRRWASSIWGEVIRDPMTLN